MHESGVDRGLVRDAIVARKGAKLVFPFRYIAAARACPQFEQAIDKALCGSVAEAPRSTAEKWPPRPVVHAGITGEFYFGAFEENSSGIDRRSGRAGVGDQC
jgi:hypothetical protein